MATYDDGLNSEATLQVSYVEKFLEAGVGETVDAYKARVQCLDARNWLDMDAQIEVREMHAKLNDKLYPGC